MIKIEYSINDEIQDEIKSASDDELGELTDIEGQFKLTIGSYSFGYVDSDIPLAEELLIHWFLLLNQLVNKLSIEKYVAFAMPDRYKQWLVFNNEGKFLNVSQVEVGSERDSGFLSVEKLTDVTNVVWESEVNYSDLRNEVIQMTDDFLRSVVSIDKRLKGVGLLVKLNQLQLNKH